LKWDGEIISLRLSKLCGEYFRGSEETPQSRDGRRGFRVAGKAEGGGRNRGRIIHYVFHKRPIIGSYSASMSRSYTIRRIGGQPRSQWALREDRHDQPLSVGTREEVLAYFQQHIAPTLGSDVALIEGEHGWIEIKVKSPKR
jgi:hypothetical protein